MRSIVKKSFSFFAALCLAGFFLFPRPASALFPPLVQFAGWSVFTFPCTCSVSLWGFFVPLYIGPIPVAGPVVYVPWATIPFANYTPTLPSVPHEMAVVPGVQACWQYVVVACVPMPSLGAMGFVGTGLPGGK